MHLEHLFCTTKASGRRAPSLNGDKNDKKLGAGDKNDKKLDAGDKSDKKLDAGDKSDKKLDAGDKNDNKKARHDGDGRFE